MDLLTKADLRILSARDQTGPHISVFMPTHRSGRGVEGDRLRWKNILSGLESLLVGRGFREEEIEDLLTPAWALHEDALAWQHMSDGLAMFLTPGEQRTFRVPVEVPEVATVGDRFVISPLLRVLSGDDRFLLLTVSQRDVRLLEGNRHRAEGVVLPAIPSSLLELAASPDERSDTMAFPVSPRGSGGPAVFYGHGGADEDFKDDALERFLRQVAGALDSFLADQDLPLVLVGLDPLVALYRDITTYRGTLKDAVRRNPDQLSAEELHALAWPVISERLREQTREVAEKFAELHGTGLASTDPLKIEGAAAEGRVETLFLATEPSCWQEAASQSPTVFALGVDERFAHCEQLDRALVNTLHTGGRIYALPESLVPGQEDVAAVFRY